MTVTRTKALRLLRKKYGKLASIREDRGAFSPEEREARRQELQTHLNSKPEPPPEVLAYNRRVREWEKRSQELRGHLWRHRWNASVPSGLLPGLGQIYRGYGGDTLEQLLKSAEVPLTTDND